LIGNQGVGKNILTYALLNATSTEMEYMQLHRDITIYSLTVQPSVIDGILSYTDSPLVKAVKHGRVLLLDECDKCPLEVLSILRSLLADGEMILSDGRRIVADASQHANTNNLIEIHKDFRVIALANRGGFPFHGNNFFDDCGDLFQTQYVDNPSGENQLQMLQSYAPDVDRKILEKLIACFEDLKRLNAEGHLQYPYSTRELVSIAKHMQAFPRDGIVSAIGNVVSFDHFNDRAFTQLRIIFERHGIPLKSNQKHDIRLSPAKSLTLKQSHEIPLGEVIHVTQPTESVVVDQFSRKPETIIIHSQQFNSLNTNHRATVFTEHRMSIDCTSMDLRQVITCPDKSIHTLSMNSPFGLMSFHPPHYQKYTAFDLSSFQHLSSLQIASLSNKNRVVLFGTTYVVSKQMQLGFAKARNVAFFFAILDPRKASEPCEKVLCHITTYKHSNAFELISHDVSSTEKPRFTLWARGNYEFHIATLLDENASFRMVHVGKCIQNLDFLAPSEYLLTTNDEHQFLVRIDGEHNVSLTRLSLQDRDGKPLAYSSKKTLQQQFSSVESTGDVQFVSTASSGGILRVSSAFDEDGNIPVKVLGPKYSKDLLIGESADRHSLKFIDVEKKLSLDLIPITTDMTAGNETSPVLSAKHFSCEDSGALVTLHQDRHLRIWDINSSTLHNEAKYWKQLVGGGSTEPMRLEFDYHNDNLSMSGPKHGKEDNMPHVGGNTYAGGSGGRDTAGLGGVGGPYRLEKKGQNVYQLSDEVKKNVSQEALEKARKMGREAYEKRLNAIDMTDHEMGTYLEFYEAVKDQIHHLRDLLENLRAKEQDRTWIKGQTSGDLDEARIIEAVIGEESIYKRRVKKEDLNPSFNQQKKPKSLRFLVDVSGSMYRFNGMDKRLLRMMELVVLLMESFDGFEHKFRYEIIGHSGETSRLVFVPFDKPPLDQKERLKVILKMHAHSQFCWSGDSTLEATHDAIQSAAQEEDTSDERIVFCFSDANLARYGIAPARFGEILVAEADVKAFAIFLAGLGDEAERAVQQMPHDHAFVCKDTRFLSKVFEEIFTSHVLED